MNGDVEVGAGGRQGAHGGVLCGGKKGGEVGRCASDTFHFFSLAPKPHTLLTNSSLLR